MILSPQIHRLSLLSILLLIIITSLINRSSGVRVLPCTVPKRYATPRYWRLKFNLRLHRLPPPAPECPEPDATGRVARDTILDRLDGALPAPACVLRRQPPRGGIKGLLVLRSNQNIPNRRLSDHCAPRARTRSMNQKIPKATQRPPFTHAPDSGLTTHVTTTHAA